MPLPERKDPGPLTLYVSTDGDGIGQKIGRARLVDDVGEVRRIDAAIRAGNDAVTSWAQSVGGTTVESGGDEVAVEVPAAAVGGLEEVRRRYGALVGATLSVGVGRKLSESSKALLAAKLRGKDCVVVYDKSVDDEVARAQKNPAEAEKIAEEYLKNEPRLTKTEVLAKMAMIHDDPKNPMTVYRVEGPDGRGPYNGSGATQGAATRNRLGPGGEVRQPEPMSDFRDDPEMDDLEEGSPYKFAFESPEHAKAWFGEDALNDMAAAGYKLVPKQAAQVLRSRSGKQVAYLPHSGLAKSDASGAGHNVAATPTHQHTNAADHDLQTLEAGFHDAAHRQGQADLATKKKADLQVDAVRQQTADALQQIRQQLPALAQVKAAFPETYEAVLSLANATIGLARAAGDAGESLGKAERVPRVYRAGDLRVPSLDHADRAGFDARHRRMAETRWSNGVPLQSTLADLAPIDLGDDSTLDPRRVAAYREMIANGDQPPPVVIDHDGRLLQGRHAAVAARAEGREAVPALLRQAVGPLNDVEPAPEQGVPSGGVLDKAALPADAVSAKVADQNKQTTTQKAKNSRPAPHLTPAHRSAPLPVGTQADGEVRVQHSSGKIGWRSVRSGMIAGTDPEPGLFGQNTHAVSAIRPNSS